jgi:predicted ribosome quality control (RQC) complex YloA/Tae2 family protein
MRLRLHIGKNAHENAAEYYNLAKDAHEKAKGVETAIAKTEEEIAKARKAQDRQRKEGELARKTLRRKEPHEKFHWFVTSGGRMVLGGRNAQQNDYLYSKMEEGDLFFHAEIHGASACILKGGVGAGDAELLEVAQFAGSFSSAWKEGSATVDVYCVEKKQVSKHSGAGFIAKGGFAIEGSRKWFKSTPLALSIGLEDGVFRIIPAVSAKKLEKMSRIIPGAEEKGAAVKRIAKMLGIHPDEVQNCLPAGRTKVVLG